MSVEYVSSLNFTTHLLTYPSSTELLVVVNVPSPLCFPMKLRIMTTPFEAVITLLIHSRNKGVSEAGPLGLLGVHGSHT
jgi:hypothetical protein